MKTNIFTDFDGYTSALSDADMHLMLSRRLQPRWEILAQLMGSIHLQFGWEGSGTIAEGAARQDGHLLFVPIHGRHLANGQQLDDKSVLWIPPGKDFTIAASERHEWCSVFLPSDLLNRHTPTVHDQPLLHSGSRVMKVGLVAMGKLRRLLSELLVAMQTEPNLTNSPAALRAIEADLLAACEPIAAGLGVPKGIMGRPSIPRQQVVEIVKDKIEQHRDEPLSIEDLAFCADVSTRTLRNIFLEYFGLPPRRYMIVQRLHQVRAALCSADPETETVTAIAARFGFWHFGRFASEYRRQFGVRPSETLR